MCLRCYIHALTTLAVPQFELHPSDIRREQMDVDESDNLKSYSHGHLYPDRIRIDHVHM